MSTLNVEGIKNSAASSNAITLASNGTAIAKLTNRYARNLIINGAMQVAQYGTSSTGQYYQTVDRWSNGYGGTDEAPTQAQVSLTSSDTGPWEKGFRKALQITNGNQTGGAGSGDIMQIVYKMEAQDIANSGWDYTSSSSYITLSFWVKSSVAQNFYGQVRTYDGTAQSLPFETGALSANTWTKITKTFPGNSNITIDNDKGEGFRLYLYPMLGTDNTGTVTLNAWAAYAAATRTPNTTTTWFTTNDSTFALTGVQLEVGDYASDYEFISYAEELRRCQRYYFKITGDQDDMPGIIGFANSSSVARFIINFPAPMRQIPTFAGTGTMAFDSQQDSGNFNCNDCAIVTNTHTTPNPIITSLQSPSTSGMANNAGGGVIFRSDGSSLAFSAEL